MMASTADMEPELQKYLEDFPSLALDKEKQKLKCRFTSHEMPVTVSAIKTYVNGKKYRKAAEQHAYNYEQYKPHLMPSTKKRHFHELFCHLTLRHIGYTPQDVKRHVNGKKFKSALKKWEACQKSGEKFVPRAGGRQKKKIKSGDSDDQDSLGGGVSEDEGLSDEDEQDDDMSDLYPEKFFSKEDSDEEDLEAAASCTADKKVDKKSTKKKAKSIKPATTQDSENSDSDYDMTVLEELANQNSEQDDSNVSDDNESDDIEANSEVMSDLDNENGFKEETKSKSDTNKSKSKKRLNTKTVLENESNPSKKKKKNSVKK